MDAPDAPPDTPRYTLDQLRRSAQNVIDITLRNQPVTKHLPDAWAHVICGIGPDRACSVRGDYRLSQLPEVVERRQATAVLLFEPIRLSWLRMSTSVILPDGTYAWWVSVGVSEGKWASNGDWEPVPNCRLYREDVQEALRRVRGDSLPDPPEAA